VFLTWVPSNSKLFIAKVGVANKQMTPAMCFSMSVWKGLGYEPLHKS